MIDIKNIENIFEKYVSNYNPSNERIKLKIDHIKRVAKNSKIIAENLKLTENQINLAIAIGFFHDLGRFEQVRIANTFSDKESKIDHGVKSCEVLFNNNFIREFIEDNKYDEIIKKSILNHNKISIKANLSSEEELFSKIIRDADKLDIFYTISKDEYSMESIFWYKNFDDEKISDKILKTLQNNSPVNYSDIQNNADVIAIFYGYIYDLYFPITKKILYENKYLEIFTRKSY